MSKTVSPRTDFGVADRGGGLLSGVFVHEFGNENETRFEVRVGNFTLLTTPDRDRAFDVARLLVNVDGPKAPELPEEVPKAAPKAAPPR